MENKTEKEKIYLFLRNDCCGDYSRVFKSKLSAMGCLLEDYNKKCEELKNYNILNRGIYDLECTILNDYARIRNLKDDNVLYFATIRGKEIEE